MDLKKSLKYKKAAKVVQEVYNSALRINEENQPFKIAKIGIGGSVVRKKKARDVDIVLEVVNRAESRENLEKLLREYLNYKKNDIVDFHIINLSGVSDRKIPYIELWDCKTGIKVLDEINCRAFLLQEFNELSNLVRKIENCNMDLPESLKPSMRILRSKCTDPFKEQLKNLVLNSLKNLQTILSEEHILSDKNTFLRDELKRFALIGLIGREIEANNNYLEIDHPGKFFEKFNIHGVSKSDFISVVKKMNFN